MTHKTMWIALAIGAAVSIALTIQLLSPPNEPTSKAKPEPSELLAPKAPEPPALSVEEQKARALAAQGIEAQPLETQQRFYEAHLRSQELNASTLSELIAELETARGATKEAGERAGLDERLATAKTQLAGKQQRIAELQQQLAAVR